MRNDHCFKPLHLGLLAARGNQFHSIFPSAIFIIKQAFPHYCMKTRYQLFSSTKIVLPHLTRQMWNSNTLISTFSLPLGSAERALWQSVSMFTPVSKHVFSISGFIFGSYFTCFTHFQSLYHCRFTLNCVCVCVCALSRFLSDLILKTPDRVSESQHAGALSHLSDEGFQVSLGQSFFLHILSMLFQPLVSSEAKEEPDTNLIPLSVFLFILWVFNWSASTLTRQVTNAELYNFKGLIKCRKGHLRLSWGYPGRDWHGWLLQADFKEWADYVNIAGWLCDRMNYNMAQRSSSCYWAMHKYIFVVQSLSHVKLFVTPWAAAHQAPLSSTISQSLLKFIFIELVILSNHPR